jgi:phage regulator Rha-like protein
MFDFDVAELYDVETRVLNQAIKRNQQSFPRDFMFRLTPKEWQRMSSQIVMTSVSKRPKTARPYVFTEHGVAMLANILKSSKARKMSIAIVRAFIAFRKMLGLHKRIFEQLREVKEKLGDHDGQLNHIYIAIGKLLDEKAKQAKWQDRDRIGFKK